MKFNILTLFPEMFSALGCSMIGRAREAGLIELRIENIRDYSRDRHNKTDDYSFGGGQGMVMMPQPAFDALEAVGAEHTRNIYMSPRGRMLDMKLVRELAQERELTVFCGHYEGVDQRIIDRFRMEEVSVGDYIVTGGELPAMIMIDAAARFIPGVLGGEASALEESVYSGLLEYPQYTKPRDYEGLRVPEVLLSGDHRLVYLWRLEQSLRLTKQRRPDLFDDYVENHGRLSKDELAVLEKVLK